MLLLHRELQGRESPEMGGKTRSEQEITSSERDKLKKGNELLLANKAKGDNKCLSNGTCIKEEPEKSRTTEK